MDETSFADCLSDRDFRDVVTEETSAGRALGVRSTPTLVLNGEILGGGALTFAELQRLIQAELGG